MIKLEVFRDKREYLSKAFNEWSEQHPSIELIRTEFIKENEDSDHYILLVFYKE